MHFHSPCKARCARPYQWDMALRNGRYYCMAAVIVIIADCFTPLH